jgi:hypothetical protein
MTTGPSKRRPSIPSPRRVRRPTCRFRHMRRRRRRDRRPHPRRRLRVPRRRRDRFKTDTEPAFSQDGDNVPCRSVSETAERELGGGSGARRSTPRRGIRRELRLRRSTRLVEPRRVELRGPRKQKHWQALQLQLTREQSRFIVTPPNPVLVEKPGQFHCDLNFDGSLWFDLAHHRWVLLAGDGLPESCLQNGDMPRSPLPRRQRWCHRLTILI